MTPVEVRAADPQQLLLLGVVAPRRGAPGDGVAVFVGASGGTFFARSGADATPGGVYAATSDALAILAGRASFVFGFTGECAAVDTACSSTLAALHVARRSGGRARVCGVGLLEATTTRRTAAAGMLSPRGRCHAFDRRADGFSRAEGAACFSVVAGGGAYDVVGTSLQQDGPSASLTAPNGSPPRRRGLAALAAAASGGAVPNAALRRLNAHLRSALASARFRAAAAATDAPPRGRVSSFGYGGTIAHGAVSATRPQPLAPPPRASLHRAAALHDRLVRREGRCAPSSTGAVAVARADAHVVRGEVLFPGVAYVEVAATSLRDLDFVRPCVMRGDADFRIERAEDGALEISSRAGGSFALRTRGASISRRPDGARLAPGCIGKLRRSCGRRSPRVASSRALDALRRPDAARAAGDATGRSAAATAYARRPLPGAGCGARDAQLGIAPGPLRAAAPRRREPAVAALAPRALPPRRPPRRDRARDETVRVSSASSGLVLHAAAEAAGDARDLGVFVGAGAWIRGASLPGRGDAGPNSVYGATATALSLLSGRVSYALDLAGPCVSLDTACSSFLFALALAAREPGALAASVGVLATDATLAFAAAGMLGNAGRCYAFDARGDGYVRGEGCAAALLGRARRESPTRARHDGAVRVLTAPNGAAQRRLLARVAVPGEPSANLEAHGTGTALGDPVEVGAATKQLGRVDAASSKALRGHLEASAAALGLLGAVRRVLATAAGRRCPRRAARLSAFGFGGALAHGALYAATIVRRGAVGVACSEFRRRAMVGREPLFFHVGLRPARAGPGDALVVEGVFSRRAYAALGDHVVVGATIFPGVAYTAVVITGLAQARSASEALVLEAIELGRPCRVPRAAAPCFGLRRRRWTRPTRSRPTSPPTSASWSTRAARRRRARAHRGRAVDLIRKNRRRRWRETATPSYVGLRTKRGENGVLQSPPPPPKAATSIPSAIGAIVPAPALVRAVALKDRATMFQTCAWATLCCPLVKSDEIQISGSLLLPGARGDVGDDDAYRLHRLKARRELGGGGARAVLRQDDAADFILSRLKARGDIVVTKDARILDAVLAKIETMYGALAFSALRATFVARIAAKLRDALEQRYEVELAPNLLELYPTPEAIGAHVAALLGDEPAAETSPRAGGARSPASIAATLALLAARLPRGGRRPTRRRRPARADPPATLRAVAAAAPRRRPTVAGASRSRSAGAGRARRVARAALGAVAARSPPLPPPALAPPPVAAAAVAPTRRAARPPGAALAARQPAAARRRGRPTVRGRDRGTGRSTRRRGRRARRALASGLDSLGVSELAGALSAAFGIALEPTFLFDHPTIAAAASGVVARPRRGRAAGADAAVDGWNVTDAAVLAL
ncbi:hypothetical protein JL721_3213 [Aureococcus anophagefferens]|nr:hypothetical protein JL721_3213 [Aureococcus anophagefferens]